MLDSIIIHTYLAKKPFLKTKVLACFSKYMRISSTKHNFWQESPANLSVFSKWNSEKAQCSVLLKFIKMISFDIVFGLINKTSRFFYYILMYFLHFCWKTESEVHVLVRAVLFFKNLKNIVKQCLSYSNLTIFLNIWKIFVFNHRNCLHVFLPLCLKLLKKLTNQCVANIWKIRSKAAEKKM